MFWNIKYHNWVKVYACYVCHDHGLCFWFLMFCRLSIRLQYDSKINLMSIYIVRSKWPGLYGAVNGQHCCYIVSASLVWGVHQIRLHGNLRSDFQFTVSKKETSWLKSSIWNIFTYLHIWYRELRTCGAHLLSKIPIENFIAFSSINK